MDFIPPPPELDDWENLTPPPEELWFNEAPAPAVPLAAEPAVSQEPAPAPQQPATPAALPPAAPVSALPDTPHRVTESLPPAGTYVPFNYIIPPASANPGTADDAPRMLQVVLRTSGDKDRDIRRLKRVHGVLRASPGKDRFSLMIFENNHYYVIEFPNETTGITPELLHKLTDLVGPDNFRVEPLPIH
mgnify:FL=1